MKKICLILFVLLVGCTHPDTVPKSQYIKLVHSFDSLNVVTQCTHSTVMVMRDSINNMKLQPLMTTDQFMQIYKYESLVKYYKICLKNPVQWKFYKGWSISIFNQ